MNATVKPKPIVRPYSASFSYLSPMKSKMHSMLAKSMASPAQSVGTAENMSQKAVVSAS